MKSLRKKRQFAFERQNGRCYYCNFLMWIDNAEPFAEKYRISVKQAHALRCTAEHLSARQDGGGNSTANIVAACRHCNQQRHKRKAPPAPEQYKLFVRKRLEKTGWHGQWVKTILPQRESIACLM